MSFRSLGKALDCFRLSILFENKRFGEVDEQIACENNKEGLANRTSDADLEDDRHQISDEKKEVGDWEEEDEGSDGSDDEESDVALP